VGVEATPNLKLRGMTIYRMDHAGVVVEDLAAAIAFFVELGLELEGEAAVEGEWVDQPLASRPRPPARQRRRTRGRRIRGNLRYCYVRGPDGIIIGLVEELR
jgi:hypothetical protein